LLAALFCLTLRQELFLTPVRKQAADPDLRQKSASVTSPATPLEPIS
jgi:hypothetical protein